VTKKDVSASVRNRLLKLSKAQKEDHQLLLVRYANERLLYRLSVSPYADQFVLKGAALFTRIARRAISTCSVSVIRRKSEFEMYLPRCSLCQSMMTL
jgi:hypothetical protein